MFRNSLTVVLAVVETFDTEVDWIIEDEVEVEVEVEVDVDVDVVDKAEEGEEEELGEVVEVDAGE